MLLACTAYNSGGLAIGADFSLVDIGEVGLGVNSELLSIDYDGEVDVCKSFIWTYPQLKKAVIDEYGNIN